MNPDNIVDESRALEHLMTLLAIEGLSGSEGNIAQAIRERLLLAGCRKSWIRSDGAHRRIGLDYQTGNLIVRVPGRGALKQQPRLLFSSHMDTVPLCRGAVPVIRGGRIHAEGNTGLGGDNRTAVAAMITMIETILGHDLPHPAITLLFTVGEETGLHGARAVEIKDLADPAMGFNIDGSSPRYVVTGAIGFDHWEAEILGRSSHAGVHPEGGVSAALIASRAIANVAEEGYFGRINLDHGTGTSNVGAVRGGEATNQVTDHVTVTGESRSHSRSFLREITATYRRAFEKAAREVVDHRGKPGRVKFSAHRLGHAFQMSPKSRPVRRARQAIEAMGESAILVTIDGALDANYLNQKGVPTVTLGAGQHAAHTTDEFVDISEFLGGCALLTSIASM